ncbi:MAG TPA: glycine--tRNA ligase subunit beta, partial [Thermodesulfovibrionales bacterium]|nr:glycine--tRNA ligase subunit beta [Thermodesulfovibrionales bacterium]
MAEAPDKISLLLEIGTEEIPARFLPPAIQFLKEKAAAFLSDYSVEFSGIRTYGTPRRLALLVDGIPHLQKDRVREVFGPPKKAAFDGAGNPSQAAIGFAASQGVDVSALQIRKKEKGEYIAAVIEEKGRAVKEVLPEILEKVVRSLSFPKSMRWGDGNLRFVRPIHWMLAVYGADVVPFAVDGIMSSNLTKGHRFLSPGSFVLKDIVTYINLMENNYVIVDQEARQRKITEGITRLSGSVEGVPVSDEALLATVTYLTEYPVPFLCEFPPKYLGLPKELLITVMRDHQKFFAVEDGSGRLKNHFIVVSNTKEENAGTVKAGAERVIKARFEDARFYYEEDLGKPLHARIVEMKRVTFHDRLGSLYDKTERVVKIASFLASRLCPEKRETIERAALLS